MTYVSHRSSLKLQCLVMFFYLSITQLILLLSMYLFNFCHRVCKLQITSEAYANRPAALTAVLCAGGDLVAVFYLTIFFYSCQIPARDTRPGTKSNSHTGNSMHLCTIGNKGIIGKKISDVCLYVCMVFQVVVVA